MLAAHMRTVRSGAAGGYGSDNFNRTDSAASLGTSSSGHTWSALIGTWGISSNRAYNASNTGGAIAQLAGAGAADCAVGFTVGTVGTSGMQAILRMSNSTNFIMAGQNSDNTVIFHKCVGGSFTALASLTTNPRNAGDVYLLTANGTTISLKKNGATIYSVTESFNSTATGVGLRTDNNTTRFDDFVVTAP